MADLKLLRLTKGDTQEDVINKLNQNFSGILSAGGGTYGKTGQPGSQGSPGQTGPNGDIGPPGNRGSIWFVANTPPTGATGYTTGDHWVDSSEDFTDYVYNGTSWGTSGLNLTGTQYFKSFNGIINRNGDNSKNAIIQFSPTPYSNTLVISDSLVSKAYGNQQYSKFLISPQGQLGKHILEFGKSEYMDGSSTDSNKHPYFEWKNPSSSNDYSLVWGVTGGGFTINSSSLDLTSQTGILNVRSAGNVSISTATSFTGITKGYMNFNCPDQDFSLNSSNLYIGTEAINVSGSLIITNNTSSGVGLTATNNTARGGVIDIQYVTNGSNASNKNLIVLRNTNYINPILSTDALGVTRTTQLTQAFQEIGSPISSGSTGAYTYGGTAYYVNWLSVCPAEVGPTGDRNLIYFNDVILTPPGTTGAGTLGSPYNGVSFLGVYGASISANPLSQTIGENRSFSLVVNSNSDSKPFYAVGIGTYSSVGNPYPNIAKSNEWKILPFPSSSITFHVFRNENAGTTGSWKVFYEANKSSGFLYEI
jgi:hypothetical protein